MAKKAPAKVLRIGLFQNNRIIEEKLFREPKPVTLGSDYKKKNEFVVPESDLPASQMIFDVKQGQYILHLTQNMTGRVKMGDQLVTLQDLIQQGRAKKSGSGYILPLDQSVQGRVAVGEATLLFQFVTPPPPRPKPVLPASMRGGWVAAMGIILSASLFSSAVIHIFPVAMLVNMEFPEPKELEQTIPDRFVQIMLDEENEPEPEPDPVEPDTTEADGDVQAEPEPAPVKKAAKKEEPKDDGGEKDDKPKSADELAKAEVERKKKLAADVQNKTILGQIGAVGGSGGTLVDRLAGGAGKTSMDDAFANSKGVTTASADTEKSGLRTSGASGGDGTGKTAGGVELGASSSAKAASKGTGTGKKAEKKIRAKVKFDSGGPAPVGGTVDPSTISRKLKLKSSAFQKCYERELKKNPKAGGKVVVVFTIGTAGRVTSSKASSDSVGGGVGSCVAGEIKRIRFGRPKGGAATIKKSFVFSASR